MPFVVAFMSTAFIVVFCSSMIWYYRYYNKKNSKSKKIIVSRKEFIKEQEQRDDFIEDSVREIKKIINDFIKESRIRFNEENDYEKKKIVLKEINKDIDMITNSFAWQRMSSIENKEKEFIKHIEFLKKQRPSQWKEII